MKIGVYGSAAGNIDSSLLEKARELGREIAKRGHIIVTGACTGLPYQAVLGAKEKGGKAIGFSPARDIDEHTEIYGFPVKGFDEIKFTGLGKKGRNVVSVHNCDAAVFISGRIGTLNEFTIAYDDNVDIGILEGTGGFTSIAKFVIDSLKKETKSKVVYDFNPAELIKKLEVEKDETKR